MSSYLRRCCLLALFLVAKHQPGVAHPGRLSAWSAKNNPDGSVATERRLLKVVTPEPDTPLLSASELLPNSQSSLEWNYTLPAHHLRRSLQNCCGARVVRVLQALERGDPVTIAVVGGSFSLPDHISWDSVWFTRVTGYLRRRYPRANVTAINAAIGGSTAGIAYLCLHHMLPPKVDLVFMDYVPNMSAELEMVRKSLYLEKLIRALLGHGGNPAVVAIEQLLPQSRTFWETSEVTNSVLFRYYDIPWISVGSSLYHLAAANASGYKPLEIRIPNAIKGPFHYNERGHKLAADLVVHYFRYAEALLKAGLLGGQHDTFWVPAEAEGSPRAGTSPGAIAANGGGGGRVLSMPNMLPPQMHPIKTPLECALADNLPDYVVRQNGWVYAADDSAGRKFGYISYYGAETAPNAGDASRIGAVPVTPDSPPPKLELSVELPTSRSSSVLEADARSAAGGSSFAFLLAYLSSYEHMGTATMECKGGCRCAAQTVDATNKNKVSVTKVHPVVVTRTGDNGQPCSVVVTNTSPGGANSKFKVTGFIVAEMHSGMEKSIGMAGFDWSAGELNKVQIKG